ncbi:MAG: ABC transporter ATP-binding protein [Pseudomonadota bacterium]
MLLELQDIHKSFPGGDGLQQVLKGVSLELDAGQTLALTGESGSGKSTLLHIAAGLEVADKGDVKIEGQNLSAMTDAQRADLRRGTVGVVFQQFNLIPSLTVEANISFQARLAGLHEQEYARHLADHLGITDQLHKFPEALSGGQQQRVAIARTLAARPKIVLADEPTGNLDETTAVKVLDQMLALATETGAALMVVTHSTKVADHMDRRVHLTGGLIE